MIVEFKYNENALNKSNIEDLRDSQRFVVGTIKSDINAQKITYFLIIGKYYGDSYSVSYEHFNIICPKIPSNWVFQYHKSENYFHSSLLPEEWSRANWTYGFWEALYCKGDLGYEKLTSEEHERAKDVYEETASRIYEECGRGRDVPDPFAKKNFWSIEFDPK